MPRFILRAVLLGLFVPAVFVTCATPTPLPTSLPSTDTPTATFTPTNTATATATFTPTPTNSPTPKPSAKNTRPPASAAGIGQDVWFMAPLLACFSKLGVYPPGSAITRPANVNPLTGLIVNDPALLQRRPILARLGNDPAARPQTGLNQADLVFEELIDQRNGAFALTRLTAVFLGQNGSVRPFRSARPINASLQPMFDGALAHSGASKGVRYLFSNLTWGKPVNQSLNLDDLWSGSAYCQIGSSYLTRFASTVEHLHETLAAKNLDKAVPLRGFDFSPDAPSGTLVTNVAFDHLPWPIRAGGIMQWNYDASSGRYLRFVNGVPHDTQQYAIAGTWGRACAPTGDVTTAQVSAANVVVLNAAYAPTDIIEDANNYTSVFIELTGRGTARIYRDGVQIIGIWQRPTLQHFFQFVDAQGNTIAFKPGNTWFEVAPLNYIPAIK